MKPHIIAFLLLCLHQAYSTKVVPVHTQTIFDLPAFNYLHETNDVLFVLVIDNTMGAINKNTLYSRNLGDFFKEYGLGLATYYTDKLNRMYAATKDMRTIYQFDITPNLDVSTTKNITNEDEGNSYMIALNKNYKAIFGSATEDPNDSAKLLFSFKIYDYEQEKFVQNGSFSVENNFNITQYPSLIAANDEYLVVLLYDYDDLKRKLISFEFSTSDLVVVEEKSGMNYPLELHLSDSNIVSIAEIETINYFPLNDPSSTKQINATNDFYLNSTSIVLRDDYQVVTHYEMESDEFKLKWNITLPQADSTQQTSLSFQHSKGLISILFNNYEWLWLDPSSGSVVDKYEVRPSKTKFYYNWISGPVFAGDHFYNLNFQSVVKRKTSDNSLDSWQYFESLGYYRSPKTPQIVEMIAVDNENGELCNYVAMNTESGATTAAPNGICNLGDFYLDNLYFTSSIQSQTQEYHDAVYLTDDNAYIYYNGSNHRIPVCNVDTSLNSCICYGNFYYQNGTVAILSQYNGEVRLSVFDLSNNMNRTIYQVLNEGADIEQIDDDNILISVPGTANLNAHMKVFNLATLQIIWEGLVPRSHPLTAFYKIIALGVSVEENKKVTAGKIVIADTNSDTFVYDMIADSIEKIDVPGADNGLSRMTTKISETQIATYLFDQRLFGNLTVYEFNWEDKEEIEESAQFLAY